MKLVYYYSPYGNLLFVLLGLIALAAGYDSVYSHNLISREDSAWWLSAIFFIFAFLLLSSFLKNIINQKKPVIEADENGITIHTGSLNTATAKINISKENIIQAGEKRIVHAFKVGRPTPTVSALEIKIKTGSIEWPPVMLSKNRIYFEKNQAYDSIIIDAWLNKKSEIIASEINNLLK